MLLLLFILYSFTLEINAESSTNSDIPKEFFDIENKEELEKNYSNGINNKNKKPLKLAAIDISESTFDEQFLNKKKLKNDNSKNLKDNNILIEKEDIKDKEEDMDKMKKFIHDKLKLSDVVSVNDKKAWSNLFDYFKNNFHKYLKDGHLSIPVNIKYVFCFYIVIFTPANFYFFFPSSFLKLIPKKSYKVPVLKNFIIELKTFLLFVKDGGNNSFITTFYIGRKNSMLNDLKLLLKIPVEIFSNPINLIKELLSFAIFADGYDDYKERKGKKDL